MNSIPNIASDNKPVDTVKAKPILVARDFLAVAILLVAIVFLWIGFGVYKILTKTEIREPIKGLVRPIKMDFPQEIFDDLKQRKNYRDIDLNESERVILNEAGAAEIQMSL